MNPEDFIRAYERALATQDWNNVDPLVHANACVTFSNGTVHRGKPEVRAAYEKNFSLIQDETYSMTSIHWVMKSPNAAVYLFEFNWSGLVNGKQASGGGRGTSVIVKEGDEWKLMAEHLGPRAG